MDIQIERMQPGPLSVIIRNCLTMAASLHISAINIDFDQL